MGITREFTEPVRADVELSLVYECSCCGEPNYIDLDDPKKDGARMLTLKAVDAIQTGKKQTSRVKHECENCHSANHIKSIVY